MVEAIEKLGIGEVWHLGKYGVSCAERWDWILIRHGVKEVAPRFVMECLRGILGALR